MGQSRRAVSELERSRLGGFLQGVRVPALLLLHHATPVYDTFLAHEPTDYRFQAALIFFAPRAHRLAVDVENSDGNSPLTCRQYKRYDNLRLGRAVTCYVSRHRVHILYDNSAGKRGSYQQGRPSICEREDPTFFVTRRHWRRLLSA